MCKLCVKLHGNRVLNRVSLDYCAYFYAEKLMRSSMQDNHAKGTARVSSSVLALPAAYVIAGLLHAQGSVLVGE